MSLDFANRICPNCKNPNYMVFLGELSKAYKYKCINCNSYFNDIDVEDKRIDIVEVVRCKDCKYRSEEMYDYYNNPNDIRYVCQINDLAIKPDWYCANGKRREDDA